MAKKKKNKKPAKTENKQVLKQVIADLIVGTLLILIDKFLG